MNNRIPELAIKAGIIVVPISEDAPAWVWSESSRNPGSLEKFAELIVRECAMLYQSIDNGNRPHGTDDYLTALKLHFGAQ